MHEPDLQSQANAQQLLVVDPAVTKTESQHKDTLPAIFLVGPMGAGKTTIGRLLAKQLQREFIDSDHYIQQQTGADIAWIFAKEGEAGFRERESRAIDELTQRPQLVLATGGGAVLRSDNRQYLHERGMVVFLDAPVAVQLKRTVKDKSRPLLQQPNPRQVLEQLYAIRYPLYQQVAHLCVPTGHTYPKQMVKEIMQQLLAYHGEHTATTDNSMTIQP